MSALGRTVQFLNSRVTFEVLRSDSASDVCVMRVEARQNDGPPLHVHHAEDEIFCVQQGEIRFKVGDSVRTARAGETLLAPRDVPHGYRVVSATMSMLVIVRGEFEALVRHLGRAPDTDDLPACTEPTPEQQAVLSAECAARGITLLGPPID